MQRFCRFGALDFGDDGTAVLSAEGEPVEPGHIVLPRMRAAEAAISELLTEIPDRDIRIVSEDLIESGARRREGSATAPLRMEEIRAGRLHGPPLCALSDALFEFDEDFREYMPHIVTALIGLNDEALAGLKWWAAQVCGVPPSGDREYRWLPGLDRSALTVKSCSVD